MFFRGKNNLDQDISKKHTPCSALSAILIGASSFWKGKSSSLTKNDRNLFPPLPAKPKGISCGILSADTTVHTRYSSSDGRRVRRAWNDWHAHIHLLPHVESVIANNIPIPLSVTFSLRRKLSYSTSSPIWLPMKAVARGRGGGGCRKLLAFCMSLLPRSFQNSSASTFGLACPGPGPREPGGSPAGRCVRGDGDHRPLL